MTPTASVFDPPEKPDTSLEVVRWGSASIADVKNIQAPFRSGINIEDYRLHVVVPAI